MSDLVARRQALQADRHADLDARLRRLLAPLAGDERALDVGCGTGALAYALAPLVGAVVGVDRSEEYLAAARADAPPNCTFATGDAEALAFPYGDFDLVGCLRVLHHAHRPELVVAELARVTRLLDIVRPIFARARQPLPAGLSAADLVTNAYVDPAVSVG